MKMNITFFLFVFFTYSCCSFCYYEVVESIRSDDEASILLTIKASIIDPLDNLRDWKLPENGVVNATVHCSWSGVECNSIGTVEKLHLSDMKLSGRVHDSILRLKALVSIDLSSNSFDRFPVSLGMASRLISLNASDNNFFGYLPEDLGNATSLESLDLRGNFFKGNIPMVYKNLRRLRYLDLAGNNLTGRIPAELGKLSSLKTIILGYNVLEGGIPREIGNLTNLEYIDLAVANLGGSIPAEIGKLKRLDTLLLYKNNLEGKIPSEIGNMTSLKCLDVSNNMLSDEIPARVADLKNLKLLKLMENRLSGTVPASIGRLTQLEVLELWNNKLSGPLPSNLGQYSPLQLLDISSNSFSGQIPTTLCSKGNLTKLILFNNAFSGPIPSSLSTCSSLVRVRMQNNNLSGTIPVGFGKLSNLQRLDLANNSLTGQIPSDLSTSTSLSFIDFSRNRLQSSLYSSILSIPSLQNVNISGNNLVGNIPDQFQDCPALAVLDLSSNHFTGSIPSSIAKCKKLVTLNLQNNQLNGPIPSRIAMMPTLAVLDLSNNSLTGEIPENFGNSPALEILNVSYNRLMGPVPSNGMLRTIHLNDLVGNSGLCGGVLPPCSQNAAYMLRQQGLRAEQVIWGWIIGISTLLTVIIAGIGARSLYQIWKNGNFFKERFKSSNGEQPWRLMAFQRLGFNRTDILSCVKESNVIGMGATGTVYKAEIQRLNTTVAVKKLWRSTSDLEVVQSDELVGEVNLLGILKHRNIVRLLGFLHNESDAMIIYEYMQNGCLGEALHGKKGGNLLVDWVSRYNIALGIAQGLAYLHHDCDPPVIHRDIKPNNILLDANLEARIADFGLARTMLEKNETVSVVAGSYGYIAPEYGYTVKVDEKSDVYSYGVVLMELLTGKKPLEVEFGESVDIVEWIQSKIRKNQSLEEVLDPSIGNTKQVQEEMLLVLGIAILCTAKLPKDRPSMRDVISMLGEAKPQRKSNNGGQTSI